jgi:predicted nuclease of predicted toxin-antitoxin system
MLFKVDENLPIEVAEAFAAAGHDAATVNQEGLQGSPDSTIAQACVSENRILITVDLGFADIRTYPPEASPGFIVLRLSRYDKDYVLRTINGLWALFEQQALEHRLWIVEDSQVRIRGGDT